MSRRGISRTALVKAACVLVALGAVAVGATITWQRHQRRVVSDVVTRRAAEIGPGAQQLIPHLKGADLIALDRPHNPEELQSGDRQRFKRRRPFRVDTNRWGTRGDDFLVPAPGYRVLAVGDSVTFGWGVAVTDAWPARLAKELGVEVINCGWPSADPRQLMKWVRLHARRLDADLVLFAQRPEPGPEGPGDNWAAELKGAARTIAPVKMGVVLPPVGTFDPVGARVWKIEQRVAQEKLAPLPVLELTGIFRAALPLPGVRGDLGLQTQRVLRMPGGEVLLSVPTPRDGLSPKIIELFENDPKIREPLFFDGGHPDEQGYQLFAREVARWVRKQGWVK